LRWLSSKDNGSGENKMKDTNPKDITAEIWFKQMKDFLNGMSKYQIINSLYRYGEKKDEEDMNKLAKRLRDFRQDVWRKLDDEGDFDCGDGKTDKKLIYYLYVEIDIED
jgi:hypothetical protein